ncbi:MAG TPA: hypothetical protein VN063_06355, partial [Methylophilaceae bacterium]|nr:hypothetical protein [Methylophilaceae bacterium]
MSLLIKALDKAEQGKKGETQTSSGELSLEPIGDAQSKGVIGETSADNPQMRQQAASTVFTAKQSQARTGGASNKILLIAAIALFVILLIAFQVYNYIEALSKPELILPRPVAAAVPQSANTQTDNTQTAEPSLATPVVPAGGSQPAIDSAAQPALTASGTANVNQQASSSSATAQPSPKSAMAELPIETPAQVSAKASSKTSTPAKPAPMVFGEPVNERKDAALEITRNSAGPRVSPDLMAAYRAFKAGDDVGAQELYRKVLRGDLRNVDALLGMAAIAQRQGRAQDAMGWYGKVLEVEPRNPIAEAAMVSAVGQTDPVATESRLKNLLAQQPNAANLHAALGSLYTERGQWSSAQQS